jgi:hypothetical protein
MPIQVDANGHLYIVGAPGTAINALTYGQAISMGLIAGVTPWSKIGYVAIPATTETDVWSYGATTATIPLLAAAATLKVQTNNAADAGALLHSGNSTGGSTTTIIGAVGEDFTAGTAVVAGDCVILDKGGATPEWGFVTTVAATTLTCANGFSSGGTCAGAARAYEVIDYSAVAGAHAVCINGLDATYARQREIVVTGGAGPAYVATTKQFLRVNSFRVIATGSGAKATAAIALMDNAGAPTITYTYISAGYTRARNSMYTVPLGKTLYVTEWNAGYVGAAASKYARIYTRASQYAFEDGSASFRSRELTGVDIFYPYTEVVQSGGTVSIMFPEPTRILQTVDIKVSSYADGAGTVTSALRGFLVTA